MPRDFSTESVTSLRMSKVLKVLYHILDLINLFVIHYLKDGPSDCADKSGSSDSSSISGFLLPTGLNAGDKNYKERKEHREKCKTYRKYSELTPPSISSCYDNYG